MELQYQTDIGSMFRTLLAPLVARLDLPPRQENVSVAANDDDELAPEDFAREVMMKLMRNTMDKSKEADTLRGRTEVR